MLVLGMSGTLLEHLREHSPYVYAIYVANCIPVSLASKARREPRLPKVECGH